MSLEEALARRLVRVENLKKICAEIFAQNLPVTFELGCGKGHYLSSYAAAHPNELCVGIDIISERVRDAQRRAKNKGAANAHFVKADAHEFFEALPEGVKFEKIFIFFPDPWPKKKHHRRRIIQSEFLKILFEISTDNASIFFRTDYAEYFDVAMEVFAESKYWSAEKIENLPFEEVSQFQRILPNFSTLRARKI